MSIDLIPLRNSTRLELAVDVFQAMKSIEFAVRAGIHCGAMCTVSVVREFPLP